MASIKWSRTKRSSSTIYIATSEKAAVVIYRSPFNAAAEWWIDIRNLEGDLIKAGDADTLTEAKLIAEDNYL